MTTTHDQPPFMSESLPGTKPDLEGLAVGSDVLVVQASYHRRAIKGDVQPIRATVTSKARVWIEAQQVDGDQRYRRSWRFRMDNQTDGSDSHYADRFYTPDQYRFRQASISASDYLAGQGIRIDWDSPWKDEARTIELARMIWTAAAIEANEQQEGRR
jgi:hypothetical protein